MGSYAASGGYWIAAEADRIVAMPSTITGSIGVYSMIPTLKKHWPHWVSTQMALVQLI